MYMIFSVYFILELHTVHFTAFLLHPIAILYKHLISKNGYTGTF